jgi:hypothetical protein
MKNNEQTYLYGHSTSAGIFGGVASFEDAWRHMNSKPMQYTSKEFCREFLGDLPLEIVQDLLRTYYPENFI